MNIGSSFTHPHVVPNLDDFFLLLNTKISLKKNFGRKTVDVERKFNGSQHTKKRWVVSIQLWVKCGQSLLLGQFFQLKF